MKINPELQSRICEEYIREARIFRGWGAVTRIAHRWNISPKLVSVGLKKHGITPQRHKIPKEDWGRVRGHYLMLGSLKRVAKLWKISDATVSSILANTEAPRNLKRWPGNLVRRLRRNQ